MFKLFVEIYTYIKMCMSIGFVCKTCNIYTCICFFTDVPRLCKPFSIVKQYYFGWTSLYILFK